MRLMKVWSRAVVATLVGAFAAAIAVPVQAQADAQPLPHNPQCTLQSFLHRDDNVADDVLQQLAPGGVLKVGINFGNPNNASLGASGFHGMAVDLSCILARRLGVEVQFIGYPGTAAFNQGFANGEWTIGFAHDPSLGPTTFAYAHPHIGVENTYLVPSGSSIHTVAEADKPGIRISVARGNSPDSFLTAHLRNAMLVRFDTVPQALAALKGGQVDAFAGSRSAEVAFLPQLPGGSILSDDIFIAFLAQVMSLGAPDALEYVDKFVERGKKSFLIQLAICRSGLVGVQVPAPVPVRDDD